MFLNEISLQLKSTISYSPVQTKTVKYSAINAEDMVWGTWMHLT